MPVDIGALGVGGSTNTSLTPNPRNEIKAIRTDTTSATVQYVGTALTEFPSTSDPVWLIRQDIISSSGSYVAYANSKTFTGVWDDRASYFPAQPSEFNTYSTNFDGVNDYITFPAGTLAFDNSTQWSFSCWLNLNNVSAVRCFYSNTTDSGDIYGWFFFVEADGRIRVGFRAPSQSREYYTTTALTHSTWYHVTVTYSGNQNINGVRVYINGSVEPTPASGVVTNSVLNPSQIPYIGRYRSYGFYWTGFIDEVSVWDVALSQLEVTSIFNGGQPQAVDDLAFSDRLLHWWRMGDGDTYPTITDNTGSLTGTLNNMTVGSFVQDVP